MPVPDQKWILMIIVVGAFVVTITTGIWIIMITAMGAFVVMITAGILMKQRIKGKEGAAGNTNTDSLSSKISEYDVFLSFRGPDARHGIVDHLYLRMTEAGLRVFKDDEEIRRGEVIEGELERAIRGSRVYVIVFSRKYASSAWCLRELDMMVDLHEGSNFGKKIILPIFYRADPADVKLRTELYREMLDAHKDRHGQEVVKKWEEALKTVGGISGWDCKAIQGEGKFVQLIVHDIFWKLRIKDKSLADHLIGIDHQVPNMLNLLDCGSSGVRFAVLHGMGGIGKTTLARVIFNELHSRFEGSSFVSDVRETSKGHGGIEKLQNKLLEDILGGQNARSCNYDGEIIRRIRYKRVLLVLDDVDSHSQLEKLVGKDPKDTLGTGSRVIITTRDKSVCNRFVRPGSELLHFYEMEKMADNYALQLFSRHAFGNDKPPEDYLYLSKQVVKTTGNLPLALEVIGGHLCYQSKELWEDMLKKLKNIPQKEVFNILKVSYDGLDCNEKEIFLDIACFQQHEMPQKYADYLWEARDLYPKCGVKVLINKSLIKIDSNGKFWIHDQLRDMGRAINRSKGDGRSEGHTRLWDPKDALKIVLQKQVSKKIIAMTLGNVGEALKLSDENFGGIANLSFLDLKSTELIGEFENLRESLMWLSWGGCSQTLNSNFFKMGRLVVLRIFGIQGEWTGGEKLMMPELKMLEFGNSDMTTSPDVSCCLKLEIMVFEYCPELKEIHHSVGKLERLAYLKILCVSLRILPESIGRLKSLRTLHLSNNKIRRLPASICDLTNLLVLDVANNPLDEGIPEEIGRLSALEKLDISYSNIRFLPATVSRLTSLKSLKLEDCKMLEELRGLPTSLTSLNASICPLDKGIPDEIGSLSALVELNLMQSKIRFLPATVSQLTSLKSLGLQCCDMLRELPRLPTSLIYLTFSTKLLRAFPNLDFLTNLAELVVSDGEYPKKDYEGERLEISGLGSLGSLSKLETLILSSSYMESVLELPLSLRKLMLLDTRTPIPWEHYSNLTLLTELQISSSILTDMDLGGLDSLPRLMTLRFYRCYNLVRVSNIGRLRKGLRSLRFRECRALVEIQGLEQLEMLEDLRIRECPSICRIQDLLGLKRLNYVQIWECSSLHPVPRLIDECRLSIFGCAKLRSFKGRYSEYEGESSKIQSEELLEELCFHEWPSFCGNQDLRGVKRLKRLISWDSLCVPRLIDECCLYIFLCHKNRELESFYSEYEGESSKIQLEDDYGEFQRRDSEYEFEVGSSDDSGEFEGSYSDYEGQSSDDSGEGGGGK